MCQYHVYYNLIGWSIFCVKIAEGSYEITRKGIVNGKGNLR